MAKQKKGILLLADIIGFSAIIQNTDETELEKRMETWVQLVSDLANDFKITNYQLISDTLFVEVDDKKEELEKLLAFSRKLLEKGLKNSFPIRGSVVYGKYTLGKKFTYGRAVIDAHNLEKEQNWVGITCGANIPYLQDLFIDYLVCYSVPLKSKAISLLPVVYWNVPPAGEFIKYMCSGGLTKKKDSLHWDFGQKVNNTISFSTYLKLIEAGEKDRSKFHATFVSEAIDKFVEGVIKTLNTNT